jgi:hypothetical protein
MIKNRLNKFALTQLEKLSGSLKIPSHFQKIPLEKIIKQAKLVYFKNKTGYF